MSDPTIRDNISQGLKVKIETRKNMGTGFLNEGIVKSILTSASNHPHGIMVELNDGKKGRVKEILDGQTPLSKNGSTVTIPDTEDLYNEFKATFQFDLKEKQLRSSNNFKEAELRKKNSKVIKDNIQKEIALTISAFANTKGGNLFVGLTNDEPPKVLGISEDLKLCKNSEDILSLSIINSLKKYIQNIPFISQLQINFIKKDGEKIIVIQTPPAKEPIYIHEQNKQNFYIRLVKGRSEKLEHEDFLKYCRERFPKNS